MEVGDVIKPKLDKEGQHWLSKLPFEKAMELFRKKEFPNEPSRFKCIFSSIIPRSRFKDKGYLYTVKATGNMLMTSSRIIDEMGQQFDKDYFEFIERYHGGDYSRGKESINKNPEELLHILDYFDARRYWEGKTMGVDKEGIEVLSDSAIVTEVIGKSEDQLSKDDVVVITENGKIKLETSIYFKKKKDIALYKDGDPEMTKYVNKFRSLYDKPEEHLTEYDSSYGDSGGNLRIKGFIKKGVELKILYAQSSMEKRKSQDEDDYHSRENYKYIRILFKPENIGSKEVLKYRLEYFNFFSREIRDITKYLKKI